MKRILLVAFMALGVTAGISAQKIVTSFWNCQFGITSEQAYRTLEQAELMPIVADDGLYLQDNNIYGLPFQVIGLKFTDEDAFYNIFGYNKIDSKQEATAQFNDMLSRLKDTYPNMQLMSRPEGCLKLYAYADADQGTAFSIGLYKGNGGNFFVRLNIFSDYLLKKVNN